MRMPPAFSIADPSGGPGAAVLAQLLDALPWPVLALRADATLLHANQAARGVLRRGQLLQLGAAGEVGVARASQRQAFDAALAAASRDGQSCVLRWPATPSAPACLARVAPLAGAPGAPAAVMLALGVTAALGAR